MNLDSKNSQLTVNYLEFQSEPNVQQSSFNTSHTNSKVSFSEPTDFSFSTYYGKKCCVFFSLLILLSLILFIGGLSLLIMPFTNTTYLNNIRLDKIFSQWKRHNYSSEFAKYSIALKVVSIALSINLKHLTYDPHYTNQKYYKPSLFYLNLSMNSSGDVSKLQQKMGVVNLVNPKGPIGKSKPFCLSFVQTQSTNASTLISNYSNIGNLPYCSQKNKNKYRGFKIIPWKRVKIYNKTENKCVKGNGIYSDGVCYKYLILKEICLEVKSDSNNSLDYRRGCYETSNSTKFFKYKKAHLQRSYNFSDFAIFVRHWRDPYVILMNFFHKEDISSTISTGFMEKLIPASIFVGISAFTFFIMIYLLLKGRVHYKFKLM